MDMTRANPTETPLDPRSDISARREGEPPLEKGKHELYCRAIGLARFIVDTDVYQGAYATSQLARSLRNPTE